MFTEQESFACTDFLIGVLHSKWEIMKLTFEHLPIDTKQALIIDYKEIFKSEQFTHSCNTSTQKSYLLKAIKLCFENDEFTKKLLDKHLDITQYFFEFDSCLRYGSHVPMTSYSFLQSLINGHIAN